MISTLLLVSVVALASSGQQQLTAEQCQKRLAGKWEADLTPNQTIVMEIKGDTVKLFRIVNGNHSLAWTAKLLVSKAIPENHFDWKKRTSVNGPLPDNQCLYRLVGDTLLLIGGGPDRRPSKFLSGHGDEPKTIIFTRMANKVTSETLRFFPEV